MRTNKGFTLIELVMVILIVGIITGIIGVILNQSFQSFIIANNLAELDWQTNLVMNRFGNDVHNIRSNTDISTITSTSLSFIDVSGNTVNYQLSGSTLQRGGITLATNVNTLTFNYYDKNYVVTTTPGLVRYIGLSITLTQNNLNQTLSTLVGTRGMP